MQLRSRTVGSSSVISNTSRSSANKKVASSARKRTVTKKRLSAKKVATRKGPAKSATSVAIGTKEKGLDGLMWVVKSAGSSRRWMRVV